MNGCLPPDLLCSLAPPSSVKGQIPSNIDHQEEEHRADSRRAARLGLARAMITEHPLEHRRTGCGDMAPGKRINSAGQRAAPGTRATPATIWCARGRWRNGRDRCRAQNSAPRPRPRSRPYSARVFSVSNSFRDRTRRDHSTDGSTATLPDGGLPYVDGPRTPVSKCVRGSTSETISR